jgi:hypothetical protein
MRSLLIKASIITSLVLSLGSGITLASASSKPGMFLYPVKQTTQKAIGTFTNITAVEIPIAVPSQTPDTQGPVVPENSAVKEIRPGTTQEIIDTESISLDDSQENEAANSAARTPVAPSQTPQMMDDPPGVSESGEGQHSATDMIDPSALTSGQNSSDPTGNQTANSPDNNSQDNSSPSGNNPDNSQNDNSYDDSLGNANPENSQDNFNDNGQDNSSKYNESQDGSNFNDNSQDNNTSDNSQDISSNDGSQDNANSDNSQDNSSSHDPNQDNSNSHDNQNHEGHESD